MFRALIMLAGMLINSAEAINMDRYHHYRGDINENGQVHRLQMVLHFSEDGKVTGDYFHYGKIDGIEDIELIGGVSQSRQVVLMGYYAKADASVIFRGKLLNNTEDDPRKSYGDSRGKLDKEIIVGTLKMESPSNNMEREGSFYLKRYQTSSLGAGERFKHYADLSAAEQKVLERNAERFLHAVSIGDRAGVMDQIPFPLLVNGKEIHTRGQFAEHYDAIFTNDYKMNLNEFVSHNMRGSGNSYGYGHGYAWFNKAGRIHALNPPRKRGAVNNEQAGEPLSMDALLKGMGASGGAIGGSSGERLPVEKEQTKKPLNMEDILKAMGGGTLGGDMQ
mgnify:FL=1